MAHSLARLASKRPSLAGLSLLLTASMLAIVPNPGANASSAQETASGPISGTVFRDYDADGLFDGGLHDDAPALDPAATNREIGQGGIVVRVYDDFGNSGETVTAPDGSYSLSIPDPLGVDPIAVDTDRTWYRIEFEIPTSTNGYPRDVGGATVLPLDFLEPGPVGDDADGNSTVDTPLLHSDGPSTFAKPGDTDVNFGVHNPAEYCAAGGAIGSEIGADQLGNAAVDVVIPCYLYGHRSFDNGVTTGADEPSVVRFDWDADGAKEDADNPGQSIDFGTSQVHPDGVIEDMAMLASIEDVGAINGTAYQSATQSLFSTAFQKRHVGFGPAGTGGIYITDTASGATTTFFDANAVFGADTAGRDPHPQTAADAVTPQCEYTGQVKTPNNAPCADWFHDVRDPVNDDWWESFNAVGQIAFGDADLSDDEQTLYTINLATRELYALPADPSLAGTLTAGDVGVYPLTGGNGITCNGGDGDIQGFGLKFHDGLLYVGVTCTGATNDTREDLSFAVYTFDPTAPGTFSLVSLRDSAGTELGAVDIAPAWPGVRELDPSNIWSWYSMNAWSDWTEVVATGTEDMSGALLNEFGGQIYVADIEFDGDDMVLALASRSGHQGSAVAGLPDHRSPYFMNSPEVSAAFVTSANGSNGVLLRACANHAGAGGDTPRSWTLEENNTCSGDPRYPGGKQGSTDTGGRANDSDHWFDDHDNNVHARSQTGGLGLIQGGGKVAAAVNSQSAGFIDEVAWYNLNDGSTDVGNGDGRIQGGSLIADGSGQTAVLIARRPFAGTDLVGIGFGKASGLGDVELTCPPAPVEVGDYVWYDRNGDGIQDPIEPGVAAVEVSLYGPDDVLIARTITDDDGRYSFSSLDHSELVDHDGNGVADWFDPSGPLTFEIRIERAADFASGGPLEGADVEGEGRFDLTDANTSRGSGDDASGDRDDVRDSDGILTGGVITAQVQVTGAGHNDHAIDFGFFEPHTLGDLVWSDTGGGDDSDNGIFDTTEAGLPGVDLALYTVTTGWSGTFSNTAASNEFSPVANPSGSTQPVSATTTTTDGDGRYLFEDLPGVVFENPIDRGMPTAGDDPGRHGWDVESQSANGIYQVRIPTSEFTAGGPLAAATQLTTASTGDPNSGVDDHATGPTGDHNGLEIDPNGASGDGDDDGDEFVVSGAVRLGDGWTATAAGEPLAEDADHDPLTDAGRRPDANTDLTLDFAFGGYDLALVKLIDAGPTGTPSTVTYSVLIANQGTTDSGLFSVTDTIPVGMSLVASSATGDGATETVTSDPAPGSSAAGGTGVDVVLTATAPLTWQLGSGGTDLPPGEMVELSFQLQIDDPDQSPFVNHAEISSTSITDVDSFPDTNTANDGDNDLNTSNDTAATVDHTSAAGLSYSSADDEDDHDTATVDAVTVGLGNLVFADLDNDGLFEPGDGESGIEGVLVEAWLDDGDGTFDPTVDGGVTGDVLAGSDLTDADGQYYIDGLTPGPYFAVVPASEFATVAEPLFGHYSSSGATSADDQTVADDGTNGDQRDDGSDPAAQGDAVVSNGTVVLTLGGEPTGEAGTNAPTGVDADRDWLVDFGFFEPASIGDLVWFDSDGNGTADTGEPPVAGVTVQLFDADGVQVTTDLDGNALPTQTDADGEYLFSGIAPGEYHVEFTLPSIPGVTFTTKGPDAAGPTAASDPSDSDADPTTGETTPTALSSGETDLGWDAGLVVDSGIDLEKIVLGSDGTTWFNADLGGAEDDSSDLYSDVAQDDAAVALAKDSVASYRFIVTNTGSTHLGNLALTDLSALADCDLSTALDGITLTPPGGVRDSITVTVTCDSASLAADFTNTARVTGTPVTAAGVAIETALGLPADTIDDLSDDDGASVRVVEPAITVEKTPDLQTIDASATSVEFTFELTNTSTGIPELTDVAIDSDVVAPFGTGCTGGTVFAPATDTDGDGRLDIGETWTYTCTVNLTPALLDGVGELTNTVTVSAQVPATDPGGLPLPSFPGGVTDSDPATVIVADLAVTKWVREVTSDGSTDPATGAAGPWSAAETVRAGDTVEWLVGLSNPAGAPLGDVVMTDAVCTAAGGTLQPFTGTAPGAVAVVDGVVDDVATEPGGAGHAALTMLSEGEFWWFVCSAPSTISDAAGTTNTVDVTAQPFAESSTTPGAFFPDGPAQSGTASATATAVEPHVSVLIEVWDAATSSWLDADSTAGTEGTNTGGQAVVSTDDEVPFRVTVWNANSSGTTPTSDLTLTGVSVAVSLPGGGTTTLTVPTLAPGESAVFDPLTDPGITSLVVDGLTAGGSATAQVSALGSTAAGGESFGPVDGSDGVADADDTDEAVVMLARLDLVKRVEDTDVDAVGTGIMIDAQDEDPAPTHLAGAPVRYTMEAANSGDVPLEVLDANDPLPGCVLEGPTGDDGNGWIDPGETWAWTCTIEAGFTGVAEVRNEMTVTALPLDPNTPVLGESVSGQITVADEANVEIAALASLGDLVWHDLDGDGEQDPGEPGLAGVTVELLDADGLVIDDTTTGTDGTYAFVDLVPGEYSVRFTVPTGFVVSPSDIGGDDETDSDGGPVDGAHSITASTTLASGDHDPSLDLGVFQLASIGDLVWADLDGDGLQGDGEPGVPGVTVTLYDIDGGPIATETTGPDGTYLFDGLVPGTYQIGISAPAGSALTTDNAGPDGDDSDVDPTTGLATTTVLTSGEHDLTWDAGIVELSSIAGQAWFDEDGEGDQDSDEPLIPGIQVLLLDEDGVVVAEQFTDADGAFHFEGLTAGIYSLEFIDDEGRSITLGVCDCDDTVDNDADPTTWLTGQIDLGVGEHLTDYDIGLVTGTADLAVDKDVRQEALTKDSVVWEITVSNVGDGDHPDELTVEDTLPADLTLLSSDGAGWSCEADGQVVSCVWPSGLRAGETTDSLLLTTQVATAEGSQVSNEAVVYSRRVERTIDNNTDVARFTSGTTATPEGSPSSSTPTAPQNGPGAPAGTPGAPLPATGRSVVSAALAAAGALLLGASAVGKAADRRRRSH